MQQVSSSYVWVSEREDVPDPMACADVSYLRTALVEIVGALPRRGGLYELAEACLERLQRLSPEELYGPGGTDWRDWTPWGLFYLMVVETLHTYAHVVAQGAWVSRLI